MDNQEIIELLKRYEAVWVTFNKDQTLRLTSVKDLELMNKAHLRLFGRAENLGCNNCITNMFRNLMRWYDTQMEQMAKEAFLSDLRQEITPVDTEVPKKVIKRRRKRKNG